MSSADAGEPRDLGHLSLREEPVGDAALIEDLDGARVQAARARAGEVLAGAPLDDGDVDPRQRQLARQHQPGRTASGDHHAGGLTHRATRYLRCATPGASIVRSSSSFRSGPDAVEEARAAAKQHRDDVQLQLVDESGRQVLVDDVGAAADEDVLVAGGLPRLLQGGLDAIGDEGERRVREGQRLPLVVGEDEDRLVEGRVVTPPALPRIVAPRAAAGRAELAPTHDLGADVRVLLPHHGAAGVLLAALQAGGLAPRPQPDQPVVKSSPPSPSGSSWLWFGPAT